MTNYQIIGGGTGDEVVVAFLPGFSAPLSAHSSHPNYTAILTALRSGEIPDPELFDVARAIENRFAKIGERVAVKGAVVYLDGDPLHGAVADQIIRVMNDDGDFTPLVRFIEAIDGNESDNSRDQLFSFLQENSNAFALGDDGSILGYKGVQHTETPGVFKSGFSGHAIVNGVEKNGQIEQSVGDVVEMPRSEVADNPSQACSAGLHVSTFDYAQGYAQSGVTLLVRFSPRDVVSVPHESGSAKVRVCRYVVEDVIESPIASVLYDRAENVGNDLYDEEYGEHDCDACDDFGCSDDECYDDGDDACYGYDDGDEAW